MLTIISLIITGLAILVIAVIMVRKFPALAILDVNNMPAEKEAKFKERIIKQKVERDLSRWTGFLGRIFIFLNRRLARFLKARQSRLKRIRINYKREAKISWPEKQRQVKELIFAADEALKNEQEAEAEEKLLEAISLDQKNLAAFFKLGFLYEQQRKWAEARQTYEYTLKLAEQAGDDRDILGDVTVQEIYFSLAEVERDSDNLAAALENIREALDREPNNPRYLDLILDLSIIKKDKDLAYECWNKLAAVNPENNKLIERRAQIDSL
jgi:tetratricopeptide (TPR) repeat protein